MSAPITVMGVSSAAVGDQENLTIATPSTATAGRLLVCCLTYGGGYDPEDPLSFEEQGWSDIGEVGGFFQPFKLLTRVCTDDEPGSYHFAFTGSSFAGQTPPMGVLMVLTNANGSTVDEEASLLTAAANPITDSPSVNLASFLDCELRVFAINNEDGFTDPGDGTLVAQAGGVDAGSGLAGSIAVLFVREETSGAVADVSIDATTSGADGFTRCIILEGEQPTPVDKLTPLDQPGTIGLPWVGA
jgi:hypothetical protein